MPLELIGFLCFRRLVHADAGEYYLFQSRSQSRRKVIGEPARNLLRRARSRWFCFDQRHVYQMLAHEPDLKLVGAEYLADHEIVSAVVADLRGTPGKLTAFANYYLMRFQQTRELNRHLFAAARRTLDLRGLSHICCHGDADAAQQLNPFSNRIDQLNLLVVMLIEQQMELIKGRAGDLPM